MEPVTLVDANILIDLFTDDPAWAEWSESHLIQQARVGPVGINPVIYAEASIAYRAEVSFKAALEPLSLTQWELPFAAGFLAGKAFLEYRRSGGERRSPLPDFYIGAHAMTNNLIVLTRDPQRYRRYFPAVPLICP
ncbi:MAG: PIN domain-containing protein [Verrucomicrobia bacterium]|nr:PIN domain-containing protein [Verrucomicrobiota bacterium]